MAGFWAERRNQSLLPISSSSAVVPIAVVCLCGVPNGGGLRQPLAPSTHFLCGRLASSVLHFQKRLDLVVFFLGELRVVSHRCLSCLLV